VRFKWSQQVYIDAGNMAVRAVPVKGAVCNFDDLDSFHLTLQQSAIRIRPDVLAGMFNESVFNYPNSKVRDFKVTIESRDAKDLDDAQHARDKDKEKEKDKDKDDVEKPPPGKHLVKLSGKVNLIAWIPFEMFTELSVDPKTNTMVISVDHLKIFGKIPATKLIKWTPMHLDKVITLPPNQSLMVSGNQIMVKPFGLFPPPRINGKLESVTVGADDITIAFAGEAVPAPKSEAKNYVYLSGGIAQFGKFRMQDTDVLILDQNQSNPFNFSIAHYADMIKRSTVDVRDLRSVTVSMPDY
jgi:hypothetical protein